MKKFTSVSDIAEHANTVLKAVDTVETAIGAFHIDKDGNKRIRVYQLISASCKFSDSIESFREELDRRVNAENSVEMSTLVASWCYNNL